MNFATWFTQREGVTPSACIWLVSFLSSFDRSEVARLFEQHQTTLMAQAMVEELEATYTNMQRRFGDLRALVSRSVLADRLALIEDAHKVGVTEAVRRYRSQI